MKEFLKQAAGSKFFKLGALGLVAATAGSASVCSAALGTSIMLGWDAPTNTDVAGYVIYYGTASQNYTESLDVGTNLTATIADLANGAEFYFAVKSYTAGKEFSPFSAEVSFSTPYTSFLTGHTDLTNNVEYQQFANGTPFGYFAEVAYPWIYHFDMGYEYVFNINNADGSVVFYDYSSQSYWYSNPAVFPKMYDFNLGSWIYYYPDSTQPGHYTSNPRYFYNYTTKQVFSK